MFWGVGFTAAQKPMETLYDCFPAAACVLSTAAARASQAPQPPTDSCGAHLRPRVVTGGDMRFTLLLGSDSLSPGFSGLHVEFALQFRSVGACERAAQLPSSPGRLALPAFLRLLHPAARTLRPM